MVKNELGAFGLRFPGKRNICGWGKGSMKALNLGIVSFLNICKKYVNKL